MDSVLDYHLLLYDLEMKYKNNIRISFSNRRHIEKKRMAMVEVVNDSHIMPDFVYLAMERIETV